MRCTCGHPDVEHFRDGRGELAWCLHRHIERDRVAQKRYVVVCQCTHFEPAP